MGEQRGRSRDGRGRPAGGSRPSGARAGERDATPRGSRPSVPADRSRAPRLTRARSRAGEVMARTTGLLGLSSTRRAAILAIVVCALALTVAVPLHNYVSQRSELARVGEQEQSLQSEVDQLSAQRDRLDDPAEVEAQARTRLGYVRPGETPYVVQLPAPPAPVVTGHTDPAVPWFRSLWSQMSGTPAP